MKIFRNILLLCLLFFVFGAMAQSQKHPWALGGAFGFRQYKGDLGNDWFKFDFIAPTGGIYAGRYLNPWLDLTLSANAADLKYKNRFLSTIYEGAFSLKLKTWNNKIFKEKSLIAPYLIAGAGMVYTKNSYADIAGINFPLGAGLRFRLSSQASLMLQSTLNLHPGIDYDGIAGKNNSYLQHNFGFTFSFGKIKDSDKDGVPDSRDKCPNTPNYRVDKNGCPLDTDQDGIADSDDQCPEQAGTLSTKGCPDTDGDGVADTDDKCPTEAGAMDGCPDRDKDNIVDAVDKCPDIPGTPLMQGCPDKDNDGIIDADDRCPDKAGTANLYGCPDSDNDGISDLEDYCPHIAGSAETKGCPGGKDENRVKLAAAAKNIRFQSGSAVLDKKSYPDIDTVAVILQQESAIKLNIEGHTDNVGNSETNKKLSQKRAEAVKQYLIKKGIASERLIAIGYGDERPIGDNKTIEGRNRNRRVDFVISSE
jgi:outer membrane protein OmpA-like peptidoglycan-associated protein